jgi:hypothetical protein
MRGQIKDVLGVIPMQDSPHGVNPANIILGDPGKNLPWRGYGYNHNPAERLHSQRNIPLVLVSSPQPIQTNLQSMNEQIYKSGMVAIPNLGIWGGMRNE